MSTSADTTDLREPWRTLWRRKFLIVLTTAAVAAVAFGVTMLQPPRYEATVDILFENFEAPNTESLFSPHPPIDVDPVRALQTEIQLIRSGAVKDSVRTSLAVDVAPEIVVEPIGQSNLIRIVAGDRNADHAAAIANAYAEAYIGFRTETAIDAKIAAGRALEAELDEVEQQVVALEERINASPPDPAGGLSASLASEREALISEHVTLSTRLRELRVEAETTGRARILAPAMAPTSPASPKPVTATALGVAWGALLGVTMAFIIEYRSGRRLRSPRASGAHHGRVQAKPGTEWPPFPSASRQETVPANRPALDEHDGRRSLPPPDGETG